MTLFSYIFSGIAALVAIISIIAANGAPQEAAGAAIALCFCVIPYAIARIRMTARSLEIQEDMLKGMNAIYTMLKESSKENSSKE